MVLDAGSKRIVDGVVKEDDILKENVTSTSCERVFERHTNTDQAIDIEQIEGRRPMNREMDVVYILSPQTHIVDCLMADLERRRYRRSYIIWTSCENPEAVGDHACESRR